MGSVKVFDPTTKAKEQDISFAPRPASFRDLRIGLVDNTKHNSDILLLKIAAILKQEHGAEGHIIRKKLNPSVPAHEEIIEELVANCHVVIAGIGD